MSNKMLMNNIAELNIDVVDFGPECDVYIDGELIASLEDHIVDGVCENIHVDVGFMCPSDNRSTELTVQVFREWKGETRLVFTRKARIVEGKNHLLLSYNGISNVSPLTSIFRHKMSYAEHA